MIDVAKLKAAPGLPLYREMRADFDYTPILRTAVEDCNVAGRARAEFLLDGFLQWMAALPSKREGELYVMLKCDIDRIFHAFVLNTAAWREFCDEYMRHFIDHSPMDGRGSRAAVEYTVMHLKATYGENLHPELARWATMLGEDSWKVSCGSC